MQIYLMLLAKLALGLSLLMTSSKPLVNHTLFKSQPPFLEQYMCPIKHRTMICLYCVIIIVVHHICPGHSQSHFEACSKCSRTPCLHHITLVYSLNTQIMVFLSFLFLFNIIFIHTSAPQFCFCWHF